MKMQLNWGLGMALVYGVFATGTLGMAVLASRSRVDVVSDDYYARALAYDEHRAAMSNGLTADAAPRIDVAIEERTLVIAWPREGAAGASAITGTVTLYRPSNAAADRVWPIAVDAEGRERISLSGLSPGRWVAQIEWRKAGRAFYVEHPLVLP